MKWGRSEKREDKIDWEKVQRDAKQWEKDGEKFARENGLTGRPPERRGQTS